MNGVTPLLGQWANFYLITSAAAASLIGLLFVVITFAAQRAVDKAKGAVGARVYLTPTVFYFASVLVVAALLSFPNHTQLTASLCTCLAGIVGVLYSGSGFFRNRNGYEQRRDLITYAILPFAAYGLLILGGSWCSTIPNAA